MKFYYRYICGLKEPDKLKTEIDAALLGQILHDVMKSLYANFEGKMVEKNYLENLMSQKQTLRDEIEKQVRNNFGSGSFSAGDDGAALIVKEVLFSYILNILKADISYLPLKIVELEKKISFSTSVECENESIRIALGGIADRIDIHKDTVRVVDYKTGTVSQSLKSISELFEDDRKKDHDGWLQTLLYCESLFGKTEGRPVRPSIYKIRKIGADYNDTLLIKSGKAAFDVDDYSKVRDEFIAGLGGVLNVMFNKNEPFKMTGKSDKCRYCAYKDLCMR
jgi:CRISPR/Cas system-associated exonuclease Cas4 (RecB family)